MQTTTKSLPKFGVLLSLIFAASAHAATVHIDPGQCVTVGSQEVCASDCSADRKNDDKDVTFACHYDVFAGSGFPNLKSYAVVKINDRKHSTTEIVVKHFGLNGKDDCEKEADVRSKK